MGKTYVNRKPVPPYTENLSYLIQFWHRFNNYHLITLENYLLIFFLELD